jgi:hypothetical protein
MTKAVSNSVLSQFRPRINLTGRLMNSLITCIPQTCGTITISTKNIRGTNTNGGVICVQDFGTNPSENNGVLSINGSIIKNEANAVVSNQPLTVLHARNTVNSYVYCIDSTLSIGLTSDDANLGANFRPTEPVYPVENFVNPALLKIVSYKSIPARLVGDNVAQNTRWQGSNQWSPSTVFI